MGTDFNCSAQGNPTLATMEAVEVPFCVTSEKANVSQLSEHENWTKNTKSEEEGHTSKATEAFMKTLKATKKAAKTARPESGIGRPALP